MDEMKELEKRWYFYKVKKNLIFLNSFSFVVMLGLGSYYVSTKTHFIENIFNSEMLLAKSDIKRSESIIEPVLVAKPVDNTIKSIAPSKIVIATKNEAYLANEVSLEPIIPIVDMEKEERKKSKIVSVKRTAKRATVKKRHIASHKKSTSKRVKAKKSAYLTNSELTTINNPLDSRKLKKINMTTTSINYIETIKKKFIKTKKPREAMLLAKAYYAKKEYSKSEEWALRANKLNNKLDESWLLFAQSKVKLGKRHEALQILVSYYQKSHSPKAKLLIEKIKTERL